MVVDLDGMMLVVDLDGVMCCCTCCLCSLFLQPGGSGASLYASELVFCLVAVLWGVESARINNLFY